MLSSIHPLGERARGNRWAVTMGAFTLGAAGGGAVPAAALGWLGGQAGVAEDTALLVLGAMAAVAAGLDLAAVPAPGPERQVNERWIGSLRGTVYGFGFGFQLGLGIATFVVTWTVWIVAAAAFLTGSAAGGALVGGVFGIGRAIAPLAAGWIDRPSRLTMFSTTMARLARPTHLAAAVGTTLVGIVAMLGWR